ncbi:MAG: hypothetical protein NT048_03300 [Flavobacterium sp.]|nr:hypothetical protein [Flavobacterium sp.]
MKKIKSTVFMYFVLFSSALFYVSCSNDNEQIVNETSNKKVDSFLKKYYSNDYHLGKEIKTFVENSNEKQLKSAQVDNFTITEVFVGDDEKARGYLFENNQTKEFESFVDVDRVNFKLTTVDLENLQVEIKNAINQMPEYSLTDEFDIIKIITDPIITNPGNSNPQVVTYGWHYQWGACRDGFRGRYRAYFLLGIRLTEWKAVQDENGHNETYPC